MPSHSDLATNQTEENVDVKVEPASNKLKSLSVSGKSRMLIRVFFTSFIWFKIFIFPSHQSSKKVAKVGEVDQVPFFVGFARG
jgi:hypothetical protein